MKIFRGMFLVVVLVLTVLVGAVPAIAAETVHLYLKLDGQPVIGESTQVSLGREGSIECLSFEQSAVGGDKNRQYSPVKCVKRVDKSSPILIKALVERKPLDAQFKFFRPNPTGDGTTQQFFTIELKQARITSYRIIVPDTFNPATSNTPPLEEILLTFSAASWTYTDGNITFSDGMGATQPAKQPAAAIRAAVKDRKVELTWSAVTVPAGKRLTGYNVYRGTSATGLFTAANRITDLPITKTALTETVEPGTYYYGLQAVWSDNTTTEYEPATTAEVK